MILNTTRKFNTAPPLIDAYLDIINFPQGNKEGARGICDNRRAHLSQRFGSDRATCSRMQFNEQVVSLSDTARWTASLTRRANPVPDGCDITCVNIGRAVVRVNAFPDQRSGRVLPRVCLVIPPRHFGIPTSVSPREIDGSNDSAVGYRESEVETKEEGRLDRVLKILPAVVGYSGYPGYRYIRDTEVPNSRKLDEEESKLRFAALKRPIAFAKSSRKYFDYLRRDTDHWKSVSLFQFDSFIGGFVDEWLANVSRIINEKRRYDWCQIISFQFSRPEKRKNLVIV